MRKLVVGVHVSVDGVMQAPGGPDEDRDHGFVHGGWSVPFTDQELMDFIMDASHEAGAMLLGRRTYEMMAGAFAPSGPDDPIAQRLNTMPKYVASRTLTSLSWNNSTLLQGDVAQEVRSLKSQDGGPIQVTGSHGLVQTLMRHDLVDRYQLIVHPVVLGSGKRLFGDGAEPGSLQLTGSVTMKSGVMINNYERAGAVEYGLFEPYVR
jgi:dihydrofolate reductase